jgi:hypothetical protein
MNTPTHGQPLVQPDDVIARIDSLIPADEVHSHPLVWRARNIDLALLIDARNEIKRLRARVEVLEQHLRDAVSVADMAMSDANGCDCHTDAKWDRDAELEVFRAALEAKP